MGYLEQVLRIVYNRFSVVRYFRCSRAPESDLRSGRSELGKTKQTFHLSLCLHPYLVAHENGSLMRAPRSRKGGRYPACKERLSFLLLRHETENGKTKPFSPS